jgi:hypothetical protein
LTVALAFLVRSLFVDSFLHEVATVKKDIRARAKQVEVPVLFLAVGVAGAVAWEDYGLIAVNEPGGVFVTNTIIIPTRRVHCRLVDECPPPVVIINRGDESMLQRLIQ